MPRIQNHDLEDPSMSDLTNPRLFKRGRELKRNNTIGKSHTEISNMPNSTTKTKERSSSMQKELKSRLDVAHYLLDITEISYIKLVALSSTDKFVRIWEVSDVKKPRVVFSLHMPKGGVHQVKFSQSYHVLLVAGYENSIPVFSITPKYLDVNVVGRLVGHVSIVTAIELIEGTPMVVTADDTGCIKTWDIRLCACFQTVDLSNKTSICQLVSLENLNRIAFIGCRVNFLEFDRFDRNSKSEVRQLVPIKAELNLAQEELVVCTNSDLRFIDIHTGQLKKIYAHMIDQEQPDEISVFRLIQKNRRFLLADPQGDIYIFNYSNGEQLTKLENQSLEVTDIKIDNYNKLIISSAADASIVIQRQKAEGALSTIIKVQGEDSAQPIANASSAEVVRKLRERHARGQLRSNPKREEKEAADSKQHSNSQFEILRTIKNAHSKNEITHLAVSVYHNMMASSSYDHCVFLYDYEFGKFLTLLRLAEGTQITALEFVNGLGILLVCTNDGYCYFVEIANKETRQDFKPVAYLNLGVRNKHDTLSMRTKTSASRVPNKTEVASLKQESSPSQSLMALPELDDRPVIYGQNILVSLSLKGENKDLEDFRRTLPSETDSVSLRQCDIYFTLQNGDISIYSLANHFQLKKILKHSNTRLNYNPTRTNTEDCGSFTSDVRGAIALSPSLLPVLVCLDSTLNKNFFAHKDGVTSISLINIPEELILTTGRDKYIKIFAKSGECMCAWNVNHPLPLKWSISVNPLQDMKNKILFALKVIQAIFKRYYNMLYIEGKIFDLKGFIKQYKELDDSEAADAIFMLTQQSAEDEKPKITVMADEYLAKDFASGKLKEMYKQELVGPSVKQLEAKRRLILAQEECLDEERQSKAYGKKLAEQGENIKPQKMYLDSLIDAEDYFENARKTDRAKRMFNEFDAIDVEVGRIEALPSAKDRSEAMQEFINEARLSCKFVGRVRDKHKDKKLPPTMNSLQKLTNIKGGSKLKPDFFEVAKSRHLINSTPTEQPPQQLFTIQDDRQVEAAPVLKPRVDFSEEGKVRRLQKAMRESNAERMFFSKAISTLNKNLRSVQYNGFPRNASLPHIKSQWAGAETSMSREPKNTKLSTMGAGFFSKKKSPYNILNY